MRTRRSPFETPAAPNAGVARRRLVRSFVVTLAALVAVTIVAAFFVQASESSAIKAAVVKPPRSIPAHIPKLGTRLTTWLHAFKRDRVNHYNGYELGDNGGGDAPNKTDIGFLPVVQTDAGSTDAIVINLGGPFSLGDDQGRGFYENKNGDAPAPSKGRVDRVQVTTADTDVVAAARRMLPRGARLVARDGDRRSGCDATIWRGRNVFPKSWLYTSSWSGPLYYFVVHYTSVISSGTMGPITLAGITEGRRVSVFCGA